MHTTSRRSRLSSELHTLEDKHRSMAFPLGAKCTGCRSPKIAIRLTSFADVKELQKRDPHGLAAIAAVAPEGLQSLLVPTRYPGVVFVRLSTAYACDACKVTAERTAAKHPDWVYVDIMRGPVERTLVAVG